jgi:hypothetical protein
MGFSRRKGCENAGGAGVGLKTHLADVGECAEAPQVGCGVVEGEDKAGAGGGLATSGPCSSALPVNVSVGSPGSLQNRPTRVRGGARYEVLLMF